MYSGTGTYTRNSGKISEIPDTPFIRDGRVNAGGEPEPEESRNDNLDLKNGANLTSRYTIHEHLGTGTFGKVYKALDKKTLRLVAIKITSHPTYNQEVKALTKLCTNDPQNKYRCIHLLDTFKYDDLVCLVTPVYYKSLSDFMEVDGCFMALPLSQVRAAARQLFVSVAYIHDMGLIHSDIKTNNIMICFSEETKFPYNDDDIPYASSLAERPDVYERKVAKQMNIRLIDFGCAQPGSHQYIGGHSGAMSYSAPEVSLRARWGYPVDIWAIACVMMEMFTGHLIFGSDERPELLAKMQRVLGPIDLSKTWCQNWHKACFTLCTREGVERAKVFKPSGELNYPHAGTSQDSIEEVEATLSLDQIVGDYTLSERLLKDLFRKVFAYDPNERITAKKALEHPWFSCTLQPDHGTVAAKMPLKHTFKGVGPVECVARGTEPQPIEESVSTVKTEGS